MFLPFYILTLGVSAGIVGVFGRRMLAAQGLLPDFAASLTVAWGIAAAYLGVQLAFVAFLRLAKPSRTSAPLFFECLSHAGALALVPYMLGLRVDFGYDIIAKVEPLLYLSLFLAIHGFFKLVTLFSTTQSEPGSRLGAVGWAAAAILSFSAIGMSYNLWQTSIQSARLAPLQPDSPVRVGNTYTTARQAVEGAIYTFDLPQDPGKTVLLRWANPPEAEAPLEEVQFTLWLDNAPLELDRKSLKLNADWTELRLPPEALAQGAQTCSVAWSGGSEASWMQRIGLISLNYGTRNLLLNGPLFLNSREAVPEPNLILIALEGVGAEHMGHFGYARETMPNMAAFARDSLSFSHAFTPAPEIMATAMTLLTGVNPLVHQYMGINRIPPPEHIVPLQALLQERGYLTAAFTEAEGGDDTDLTYGSGIERGFDHFDVIYPPEGSRVTLNKAARWLEDNQDTQLMLFLRVRELRRPNQAARYGGAFSGEVQSQRPMDIYDDALAYLDKHLGEFLDKVRAMPGMSNTCIAIASTYGFDHGRGWSARGLPNLSESSLRVPLYISAPRQAPRLSNSLVELGNLGPTLAEILGVEFPHPVTGRSLLQRSVDAQAISMTAEPLTLSLRTEDWRFTWQTGLYPFTQIPQGDQGVLQFINISYYLRNWRQENYLVREATLARRYRDLLWNYAQTHLGSLGATPEVVAPQAAAVR